MQYDGNEPAIYGYKDTFNDTEFKVLKTDAPFLGNDLTLLFNKVLDEFLTRYGICLLYTSKVYKGKNTIRILSLLICP